MSEDYKFKDRLWDVKHSKTGKNLGRVWVNADSVREASDADKSLPPEDHQGEILNNALWKFLDEHKLNPEDIEIAERVSKQNKSKHSNRKSSGGRSCW